MPKAQHPGSLHAEDASANPTMAAPNNVRTQSGKEYHQLMGSLQYRKEFEQGFLRAQVHGRSEEHTSELQSRGQLVCRLLLEKKKFRCWRWEVDLWCTWTRIRRVHCHLDRTIYYRG